MRAPAPLLPTMLDLTTQQACARLDWLDA